MDEEYYFQIIKKDSHNNNIPTTIKANKQIILKGEHRKNPCFMRLRGHLFLHHDFFNNVSLLYTLTKEHITFFLNFSSR